MQVIDRLTEITIRHLKAPEFGFQIYLAQSQRVRSSHHIEGREIVRSYLEPMKKRRTRRCPKRRDVRADFNLETFRRWPYTAKRHEEVNSWRTGIRAVKRTTRLDGTEN